MKSKITTKKGDKGFTCMWSKEIISKDDFRVETLGSIDELIAFLGIIIFYLNENLQINHIHAIQNKLSVVCAELMSTNNDQYIIDHDVKFLDDLSNTLEKKVILPEHWWFFGERKVCNYLNYARTLARKCERNIVKTMNNTDLDNECLIKYFNRLSDYLYLLMLYCEQR